MSRGRGRVAPKMVSDVTDTEAALEVLTAEELRELLGEWLLGLEEEPRARLADRLIERAASKSSGWTPHGPTEEDISEILSYVEAGMQAGYADAEDIEEYLRQGTRAFLARDYSTARRIFGALLPPIGDGELYLGQEELAGEVLDVDVELCAIRYVVSTYMTSPAECRPEAVYSAMLEIGELGFFWEPLREMERAAVEPFPGFDEFLPRWRALVEENLADRCPGEWDRDQDHWLREVTRRLEGAEGLARIARSTRRGEDLKAWCGTLVSSRDWKAALSAFEESAELVPETEFRRGDFLDGAALAAQELGRRDLPARLETAWRGSPSLPRLRRWLGSARSKARVRKLATGALEVCPERAGRQRAVLHLVLGDIESAAECLAVAPGLGWSGSDHPGHLLFSLFPSILEGQPLESRPLVTAATSGALDLEGQQDLQDLEELGDLESLEELGATSAEPAPPRLRTPGVTEILETAGVRGPLGDEARAVVLSAMRGTAKKRVDGVVREKRRRHYDHAARLVGACASLDRSTACVRWIQRLRTRYSRYPALQRELDRHVEER